MPYMINMLAQQTKELATLKADNEARKSKEKETEKTEDNTPILGGSRLMITAGPGGVASPAPYGQTNGFAPQPTGYGF
jgi:clathrin heavy chain